MTLIIHEELIQGSDEWFQQRLGKLTASEMHLIITPTLKTANNEKTRIHLYELLAQRVTQYVEPTYIGDDMLRGLSDEIDAKILYSQKYAPVTDVGFVTNDKWGFTIGYSPDGFVGKDGQIECKSRRQKYQAQTIVGGAMPDDYLLQVQTGLMVTERAWCDFVSYCGGMPMFVCRVYPDHDVHNAIAEAASAFEGNLRDAMKKYNLGIVDLHPTERKIDQGEEIIL